MITAKILRHMLKLWFGSTKPSLFVTHNFGSRVTMETGVRSLTRFYHRLQRQVHGRNWNKRLTDNPMIAVGVWEHLESNPHCHVLVAASNKESSWLFKEGADSWLELQTQVQLNFSKIESLSKVISYVTKEILCAELARPAVRLQSAPFQGVGRLAAWPGLFSPEASRQS